MASRNWPHILMEVRELRLSEWVVRGESFVSKYKPSFTWKMNEEFAHSSESIVSLFLAVCLSNSGLSTFHREVKNLRYRVFFESSRLKRESQQTPYRKILFEAVFSKEFCHKGGTLRGYKAFSFKFWSLGKLKSAIFRFLSGFPLKSTVNLSFSLEPEQFPISRISRAHQRWRHKFYFRQFSILDRSTIMKAKKQWFLHFNISPMLRPVCLKLRNMFILYFHIGHKFWFI